MKNKNLFLFIIIACLFTAVIVFYSKFLDIGDSFLASMTYPKILYQQEKPHSLDDFARCLTEKGIKLYGTSWDGHTKNQKEIFGEAVKYLSYIECMKEEGGEISSQCKEAEIKAFPTWEFPAGEKRIGEISLEGLEKLSECSLR